MQVVLGEQGVESGSNLNVATHDAVALRHRAVGEHEARGIMIVRAQCVQRSDGRHDLHRRCRAQALPFAAAVEVTPIGEVVHRQPQLCAVEYGVSAETVQPRRKRRGAIDGLCRRGEHRNNLERVFRCILRRVFGRIFGRIFGRMQRTPTAGARREQQEDMQEKYYLFHNILKYLPPQRIVAP